MSGLSLSPRDRRVLLTGIAVIAVLLLVSKGIPAWVRWEREARASAAEMSAEAARAGAQIRAFPAAVDSLEARRERLEALAPALLDGESPAAAGATLASILSGAAAQASVRLGAVQVRPDSAGSRTFVRVSVRGDATGDMGGITRMLRALEEGPELLAVRELSITQPEPGAPPDRPEALRVEFAVEGLAIAPTAAAGRKE